MGYCVPKLRFQFVTGLVLLGVSLHSVLAQEVATYYLDTGSGNVALDNSVFANNANFNGTPSWVPGVSGTSVSFKGGSDRLLVNDSASLDISSQITLAAWIRPNVKTTQYLVKKARADSTNGYELGLSSTGVAFVRFNQFSSANGFRLDSISTYPTTGTTWMHLAASYDGATIRLYVNGVLESTKSASFVIATNNLSLSIAAQDNGVYPYQGALDEIHIDNIARSATDVAAWYAVGVPPDADSDGIPDSVDRFPNDPTEWADNDNDGIGDNADTDDDNDGMSDSFEIQYNFNPYDPADAAQDANGNGISNLDEFLAGSDPRAVASGAAAIWNLNEGSGISAADSSGNGNNLSFNGSPTWVTGISGSALTFKGGSDRLLVSDSASLDISKNITLAVWMRPSALATQYLVKKARAGASNGFELGLSSAGVVFVRFNQFTSGNTYRLESVSNYPSNGNTWMHVAATYDGTAIRLYINGVHERSLSVGFTIATNNLPLSIGAQDNGVSPFKGTLDEIRITNTASSLTEIEALYAVGKTAKQNTVLNTWNRTVAAPLTITADVGHKPQHKIWYFGGYSWAMLADQAGTWVWRLDGSTWSPVRKVSTLVGTRADVKVGVDGVVHAVLTNDITVELTSLEFVPGTPPSYAQWTVRPGNVTLPVKTNTEAVTFALDSNAVMWAARDHTSSTSGESISVDYSEYPYTDWSNGSVLLASGVSSDDISALVRIGNTAIGVLWSDQNRKQFGFRVHHDVNLPDVWSATEYPGLDKALLVGTGFADDHISLAAGADGSVYAALKTSYDTGAVPTLGLFVRNPFGVWGNMIVIEYSKLATRPIVQINESDRLLEIFYSDDYFGGNIVYKESNLDTISLGLKTLLLKNADLTNTSSSDQGFADSITLIASPTTLGNTLPMQTITLTK